ncbi:MAG: AMP-binding protein [Acidimicrobiia bacterium]|nr:AMP-binding protein [Acidimicrobiia bacterium]
MVTGGDATTFAQVWAASVAARPDAPFLLFESSAGEVTQWSYGEFDSVVARVAGFLLEHEVDENASIHLALTNSPTFVAVWLASVRLGAWIVPSDPQGTSSEFADHIDRTQPVIGFCASSRSDTYQQAVPSGMAVVEIDEDDTSFAVFGDSPCSTWPELPLLDVAAVMFTSGTTGRPKGVEITQANYAFAGKIMAEATTLTSADRHIVVLPLFHANAQYYSFASAIWVGASVALMHTFSATRFLEQCARHQATVASLFAAPIRMILARSAPTTGLVLRHCWFAQNLAEDQYDTITAWLGCRPRQLYGMTETIPAVLSDGADLPRADTMGGVTAGCEVDIHDADGQTVPQGDPTNVGEIVVGGEPGLTLFAGYLDDPETTAASFRDGWFLTGDRAGRDSDGRFFFDGRRSDVLKVAGENVSTVEVEAVLTAHPAVLEASVVGAPDEIRDEVPVAFVVAANADEPPDVHELHAWCEQSLGKAKRPREITLLPELPRTSVGKIRKFLLKDEVQLT